MNGSPSGQESPGFFIARSRRCFWPWIDQFCRWYDFSRNLVKQGLRLAADMGFIRHPDSLSKIFGCFFPIFRKLISRPASKIKLCAAWSQADGAFVIRDRPVGAPVYSACIRAALEGLVGVWHVLNRAPVIFQRPGEMPDQVGQERYLGKASIHCGA